MQQLRIFDSFFKGIVYLSALIILGLLLTIVGALFIGAKPALLQFGWSFFTSSEWNPVTERFGALAPIYGTVITSVIALIIAVPISFGVAIFLTEISPPFLKTPIGIAIELLAAIPSIIYGMWGLLVFAPFFSVNIQPWIQKLVGDIPYINLLFEGPPIGIGVFTASLILAVMIVPFIASVMRDSFDQVPPLLKESAYGLGSTKWEVTQSVILPYTKVNVVSGIILGLARALGETMAVTFVIGNSHDLSPSLFRPGNTISSALANEFNEAIGEIYTASLVELGLVLFLITFIVLAIANFLLLTLKRKNREA